MLWLLLFCFVIIIIILLLLLRPLLFTAAAAAASSLQLRDHVESLSVPACAISLTLLDASTIIVVIANNSEWSTTCVPYCTVRTYEFAQDERRSAPTISAAPPAGGERGRPVELSFTRVATPPSETPRPPRPPRPPRFKCLPTSPRARCADPSTAASSEQAPEKPG